MRSNFVRLRAPASKQIPKSDLAYDAPPVAALRYLFVKADNTSRALAYVKP